MAERIRSRLGQTLFTVQSSIAFGVFLFAGQREVFPWADWVTSIGLALWAVIGVPLLIIYRRSLSQKLPWSVLIPLNVFFLFAGIPPSDLYQAGLLTPLSVTIGLICAIIVDEGSLEVAGGGNLDDI